MLGLRLLRGAVGCRGLATKVEGRELVVEHLGQENQGIVVLGINRPKAMNALSKSLVASMEEAIAAVRFDKTVRVLVIRSHAR